MSAAPWSVKGIDPKAREVAKDLARRNGMTLGEWLNTMIMEDGDEDEDSVVPLGRRPHAGQMVDRRSRSRRMDDAYSPNDDVWLRLSSSVDGIARRLEASEQRSTAAIQGIDQAVAGIMRQLEGHEVAGKTYGRRIDDIAEELKEGHRRLRQFEHDTGPRTTDALGKVEGSIGGIASRLYDIEERQRSSVNELRQRMDAVEKAAPGAGADALTNVARRLDEAQGRTNDALRDLEKSFATLDQRLRNAETRIEPEGARAVAQFEKLAETLTRQIEANRDEMIRRLDTAESENRIDRIERALLSMTDQVRATEERSARAVEQMGQEVMRIAQNLNGRLGRLETDGDGRLEQLTQNLSRRIDADVTRATQGLERRLTSAEDRQALALEKLGGEITRISDQLGERIAQSERRSAQALEDIGRRLVDNSSRVEQRYERASGELAERMRQSEERTASLIAEARQNMDRRGAPSTATTAAVEPESDWRAAAFPGAGFPTALEDDPVFVEQQAWSADLAPPSPPEPEAAPEPEPDFTLEAETPLEPDPVLHPTADPAFETVMRGAYGQAESVATPFGSAASADPADMPPPPVFVSQPEGPATFGQGFGGADVSDALAVTADDDFDDAADEFSDDADLVATRHLRTAAVEERVSTNRTAVENARAAMEAAEEANRKPRLHFGLKRGGKGKSQDGGTMGKALGASAVAILLVGGGVAATNQLTGGALGLPGLTPTTPEATPTALLATTNAPVDLVKGEQLYQQSITQLDADDARGVETLKQAALLGYGPAQLHLAGLYQDGGKGVAIDPAEARSWAKRAADAGDARGMHAYGMYLFDGVGGATNTQDALAWLERAANKGLVDSQFNVAKLYETGDTGIAPNPVEAYRWYLIAARAGDTDAQAAVERLRATMPAAERGAARVAADRFKVEPLG
ncbi:hypothetical protein ACIQC9_14550 [Brevundimonas sp. NPDC092305]|uniref:hypothetical protein n=1 Tax=Brevundimonas sp. NPDC092305 TaxID=3363957 RepID=UPI0038167414